MTPKRQTKPTRPPAGVRSGRSADAAKSAPPAAAADRHGSRARPKTFLGEPPPLGSRGTETAFRTDRRWRPSGGDRWDGGSGNRRRAADFPPAPPLRRDAAPRAGGSSALSAPGAGPSRRGSARHRCPRTPRSSCAPRARRLTARRRRGRTGRKRYEWRVWVLSFGSGAAAGSSGSGSPPRVLPPRPARRPWRHPTPPRGRFFNGCPMLRRRPRQDRGTLGAGRGESRSCARPSPPAE